MSMEEAEDGIAESVTIVNKVELHKSTAYEVGLSAGPRSLILLLLSAPLIFLVQAKSFSPVHRNGLQFSITGAITKLLTYKGVESASHQGRQRWCCWRGGHFTKGVFEYLLESSLSTRLLRNLHRKLRRRDVGWEDVIRRSIYVVDL